jgi:hypothetical protein
MENYTSLWIKRHTNSLESLARNQLSVQMHIDIISYTKMEQNTYEEDIIIDLSASNFEPGKKTYERVKWCLTERMDDAQFICMWTLEDKVQEIKFPEGVKFTKVLAQQQSQHFEKLKVADVKPFLSLTKQAENLSDLSQDFTNWLGFIHCRALRYAIDSLRCCY